MVEMILKLLNAKFDGEIEIDMLSDKNTMRITVLGGQTVYLTKDQLSILTIELQKILKEMD